MYVGNSLRTYTGVYQNIRVCGHVDTGVLIPHKNTAVHVEGDEVGAGAAVGLPVGLGVAVRQLAGPVRVGFPGPRTLSIKSQILNNSHLPLPFLVVICRSSIHLDSGESGGFKLGLMSFVYP